MMKPTRYHLLLALAPGPLHGAEIRRKVSKQSDGTITLYPAMLYGSLDELREAGWIREVEPEDAAPESRRWRFYGLTEPGRMALERETERLASVVTRARDALGAM